MRHILFIFGTRPEAIKLAPVILLAKRSAGLRVTVCTTGQHREMLRQVLDLFGIEPQIDLQLMKTNQTLPELTAVTLKACTEVLRSQRPDVVIVHGDTTTTLAASLAAFYERVPVAHVEAGLRTGDLQAPWPEELNRRLTGVMATLHFAPTDRSRSNLLAEGVEDARIEVTGNTVIDALQLTVARIRDDAALRDAMERQCSFVDKSKRLVLVTGHRRENFGQGMQDICRALKEIAERGDVQVVYPVHLNPNVQGPVRELLGGVPGIVLVPPLEYTPFVHLLSQATLVLTDSGGIQEEAPALGVPVLVMREVTERPEAIEAGTARLVGTQPEAIVAAATLLLDDKGVHESMSKAHNPFGDGHAAARIVERLSAA